ncbi:MAG: hypothetical protein U1F77_01785 [Kiritimatiellia bacterium]
MKASRQRVEMTDSLALPNDSLALQPYDSIALVNVPAESPRRDAAARPARRRLPAVTGLVMLGGDKASARADTTAPPGRRLPVTMDVKQKKVFS